MIMIKESIVRYYQKYLKNLQANQIKEQGSVCISQEIIEAHSGTIMGYNNLDQNGATFEFTLLIEKK